MKKIFFLAALILSSAFTHASCPSVATLKLESSGYQGIVNIELRKVSVFKWFETDGLIS
jgi:hypothetical protein